MDEPKQEPPMSQNNEFIFSKYQLQIISILECMDISTLIISKEHKVLYANKYFFSTTGFDIDHVIGNQCYQIVCNKTLDTLGSGTCPLIKLYETKKPFVVTSSFFDKEKNEHLAHTVVSLIHISETEEACLYMIIPVVDKTNIEIEAAHAFIKSQNLLDIIVQHEQKNNEIRRIDSEMARMKDILTKKNEEFNLMYNDVVNRENKMVELKKQITDLEEKILQSQKE
jgi:hypothetical protein